MKTFKTFITEAVKYSKDEAIEIGKLLSVDWNKVDIEQFRMGLEVESEHDYGDFDVVKSKSDLGKIVLAHLDELPDYYTRLKKMEEDAPANAVGSGEMMAGLREPVGKKSVMTFAKRKNSY